MKRRHEDFDSPQWLLLGFVLVYVVIALALVAIIVRSL